MGGAGDSVAAAAEACLSEWAVLPRAARWQGMQCIDMDRSHRRPRPGCDQVVVRAEEEVQRGAHPATAGLGAAAVGVAVQHEGPLEAAVGCRVV